MVGPDQYLVITDHHLLRPDQYLFMEPSGVKVAASISLIMRGVTYG